LTTGQHVAVLAENSTAWIIAFLGAIAGGAVAVPLATRVATDEIDVLLEHAGTDVIAVDDALLPLVEARWRDRVLRLTPPGAVDSQDVQREVVRGVGNAPACLTYTSGTTSRPKGVLLRNSSLTRASECYAAIFHSTPDLRTVVAVPLCHNTGFVDQLGHTLVAGGSIEVHRRFRAEQIAAALQSGACSYFIGVPTMYHRILEHLADAPPCTLSPWLAFGGAPMPSQLIARLQRQFPNAPLANCYGLSEATSITHINFVGTGSVATEVGVAVAGTIDRISSAGELLIRSPTAMLGYHRNPEATAAKFEDGWLRTGDLASRDDDGMVHIYGRIDDVINRGGEKVVPLEVEEALCDHPAIVEAAVVGLPDVEYGTIVVAAVVTSEPIASTTLDRYLEGCLADYKRPAQIVMVDRLPRNENGKVLAGRVRDLVGQMLASQQEQQGQQ
ncbi:MAG: long-chain acyl-CoA synthetase, partial [Ilumatobacteraceae bacterium]